MNPGPDARTGKVAAPRRFLSTRARSIGHALDGARNMVATQPNAGIHLVATVVVVVAGGVLRIGRFEWIAIVLAIAAVWSAEALNTALESLADEVSLEQRNRIGRAKDVAAFAVLTVSVAAAVVGLLVFVPAILSLLGR